MDGEHIGQGESDRRAEVCQPAGLLGQSHVSECSGFEDKGRLKTQVTGGSAIGGEKAIRRGQWRKPVHRGAKLS